jgi:hypothetical protein
MPVYIFPMNKNDLSGIDNCNILLQHLIIISMVGARREEMCFSIKCNNLEILEVDNSTCCSVCYISTICELTTVAIQKDIPLMGSECYTYTTKQ